MSPDAPSLDSRGSAFLALDLGAESGRAVLGRLENGRLQTKELHRFTNAPLVLRERLQWDLPAILRGAREGLRRAALETGGRLDGIAVDSWGVDFGLLDRHGELLALPVHYRDTRTRGWVERLAREVPPERLWSVTGIQSLEINTLFQLAALRESQPELLDAAATILPMADLVASFLGGAPRAEVTLASTTQLLDARTRRWAWDLIDAVGLPRRIFPEIAESGEILGVLREDLRVEAGFDVAPPIIAAASHDTACAVAAVPARGDEGWAFLSSGTWSLLGVETDAPCLDANAMGSGFTNEAGVGGTTRLLAMITGLWIVQECRREWAREDGGRELSYAEIAQLAREATPSAARFAPNDPRFAAPGDMPRRIAEACSERGATPPRSRGETARVAFESLADAYAAAVGQAASLTSRPIERLHVVGGGSQNELLNELTARALGIPLLVGPVEATAWGNVLSQALATGVLASREELRAVVARSAELREIEG